MHTYNLVHNGWTSVKRLNFTHLDASKSLPRDCWNFVTVVNSIYHAWGKKTVRHSSTAGKILNLNSTGTLYMPY